MAASDLLGGRQQFELGVVLEEVGIVDDADRVVLHPLVLGRDLVGGGVVGDSSELGLVRLGQKLGHQPRREVDVLDPRVGQSGLVRLRFPVGLDNGDPLDVEGHYRTGQGERGVDDRIVGAGGAGRNGVGEHRHAHCAVGGIGQVLAGLVVVVGQVAVGLGPGQVAQLGLPAGNGWRCQLAPFDFGGVGVDGARRSRPD